MADQIASFYATIGADTKNFASGLVEVKAGMSGLEATSNALGVALQAAFAIGVAGVVGFGSVISDAVGRAADMEQSVADIGAVMNTSAEDTQKLHDHILDLGLDPKLKVTATEAAEAIEQLGTAGISATDIMNGASKATILLANATGLSGGEGLAKAANIATDTMQQFNVSAADLDAAVSKISGTTIASKMTIDDYRLAIGQAGGVAGALGVDFDDFNAALAATASSFASGSDAGTSFKVFLQRLEPTTDKAKEMMQDYGLTTAVTGERAASLQHSLDIVNKRMAEIDPTAKGAKKELKDLEKQQAGLTRELKMGQIAFFNQDGSMRSMNDIAGVLQHAFGGLSEEEKNHAASTIFGTDAMRTALALAKGGPAIIDKMKASIGNVNAEELAAKRMDTFKGSVEIAQGVIETISIAIGEHFLPVLRPLVDRFTELAQTYGPQIIAFFGGVADGLAKMLNPLLEASNASGPLFEALVGIYTNMVDIVDAFKEAFKPMTDVIGKFLGWKDVLTAVGLVLGGMVLSAIVSVGAALAPVILTLGEITAAVALFRWAWQNDFANIRTSTQDTVDKITFWFYESSGLWQGTWQKTAQKIYDLVYEFFRYKIFNTFMWYVEHTESAIHIWALGVQREYDSWAQYISDTVSGWVNDIVNKFTNWKDRALSTFHEFFDPIKKEFDNWVIWGKQTVEHWVSYWTGDFGLLTKWKNDAIELFNNVKDWWKDNIQPWIDYGTDLVQGLWDKVRTKWDEFTQWWSGEWEDLRRRFESFFGIHSPSTVFYDYGDNIVTGLANGISDNAGQVLDAVSSLSASISDEVTNNLNPYSSLTDAFGTQKAADYASMISSLGQDAAKALQARHVAVGNDAYNWANMLSSVGTSTSKLTNLTQMMSAINTLIDQLNNTGAATASDSLERNLSGISSYFSQLLAAGASNGASDTYPMPDVLAPSTGTSSPGLSTDVIGVLRAILAQLQKNGDIDGNGFSTLSNILGRTGGADYGGMVSMKAALR